ncbi:MAG: 3,4-dihydroxy-2-butanone-4-phosphate synthase [Polyangiaceae bacterium]|jgi:3,4-dihydroxy 2-butanone 4-phosphate synthase/GTP cyclohydrolase II|nr:3,4-dihydroxy-2-butanone-4-phosphate synthase [Polyangiaceae bacterium]MBK8937719.1 3,4-dihydroxy-2-butanone-4-phosphate synthase [Polyangiaceae bacterium]
MKGPSWKNSGVGATCERALKIPDPRPSTRDKSPASTAPAPQRLTIDAALLDRVNHALAEIRAGRMVILVDDEDRENEGDLVMAAELVSAEAINFMAKFGRGLICLTLTEEQVEQLELPMMSAPGRHGPPLGTAFTVSIEARTGVTSGISAADRARTVQVAVSPEARPSDLVTPGHIFPLKARRGGVLVRTGHTEGSVDIARLAGLGPAGVICEIMNDDGSMARMADLERFAKEHGLSLLTIADLIQYRLQTERLVVRAAETTLTLDVTGTEWSAVVFDILGESRQFLALVKGELDPNEPVLTRVHAGGIVSDVFSSTPSDGGANLRQSMRMIEAAGRGVILYIPSKDDLAFELSRRKKPNGAEPPARPASPGAANAPLREFGLGAQVLAALGAQELRLISNNQAKIAGIHGFGLKVVERIPILPE